MLSVILNLITLGIVAYFIFVYQPLLDKKAEETGHVTASEALRANLKDPNVVSRAYFTESKSGSIGGFVGYDDREFTSL
jgi:hypothetical protein